MSTDDEVIVSTLIDAVTATGKRSPVRRKVTSPHRRRSSRLQLEHLEPREVPAVVVATSESSSTDDASSEVLPLESFEWHPLKQVSDWAESNLKRRNTIRRSKKARQRVRSVHKTDV